MRVGTIVELLAPYCLGNPSGTLGIVYCLYEDFDTHNLEAAEIIFENGDGDGFSAEEQKTWIKKIGVHPKYTGYIYISRMSLNKDFKAGYFNFNEIKQWIKKDLRKEKLKKINSI